jgi:hypothetical protein
MAGCHQAPPAFDLPGAEAAVRTALDAWKRGEPVAALRGLPSPIEFQDDDWQAGASLIEFDVIKTFAEPDGARCSVVLTVKRPQGQPERKEATYHVKTEPKLVIARDPYF